MEHRAESAGLSAFPGGNISVNSAAVMEKYGIDASSFRSGSISRYALDESDLIICMTRSHLEAISSCAPEYREKLHTLLEWSSGTDVPDPYGGDINVYEQTFSVMKKAIDNLADFVECSVPEQIR